MAVLGLPEHVDIALQLEEQVQHGGVPDLVGGGGRGAGRAAARSIRSRDLVQEVPEVVDNLDYRHGRLFQIDNIPVAFLDLRHDLRVSRIGHHVLPLSR